MSEKQNPTAEAAEETEKKPVEAEPAKNEKKDKKAKKVSETERLKEQLAQEHDQYLRLAAEYDNFRKRSQREKDGLYQDAKADTAQKFLPVYDNLERALKNETTDEAYKKGVEMTRNELVKTLAALGIEPFGAVGEAFDPTRHNAVMHIEDEALGENTIAEVFQTGFAMGDKIVRFAMVKVAN